MTSLVPCGLVRKLGKLRMIAECGCDHRERGGGGVNPASGACMSQASAFDGVVNSISGQPRCVIVSQRASIPRAGTHPATRARSMRAARQRAPRRPAGLDGKQGPHATEATHSPGDKNTTVEENPPPRSGPELSKSLRMHL